MQTWRDYELASAERFWDGVELAGGRADGRTGAVYLPGYVGEMTLKAAFFRARGVGPGVDVRGQKAQLLLAAKSFAGTDSAHPPGSYHNLEMLRDALLFERRSLGRPLSHLLETELRTQVAALRGHWNVDLRYAAATCTESGLHSVFVAAEWFLNTYPSLY